MELRASRHLPTMIANLAITYRCQCRCRTCNIWKKEETEREELALEEYHALFESNMDVLREVRSIQITGGEPFMRRDLPELVSTIHASLPDCTFWIPTNGMNPRAVEEATKEMLEHLKGRGVGVSVSVDGMGPTHNVQRGVVGSFRKAMETLRRLSALREEHPRLGLTVGMTLTPQNYREASEVYPLARRFGADFSMRPVNFSDIYYRNMDERRPLDDVSGELLPLIRTIARDTVKRKGIIHSAPTLRYMQGIVDYIRDPTYRSLPCAAGEDSFFLDPYGDVYPCIFVDEKMGNIREEQLADLWWTDAASSLRERISRGDCPGCWVECETYREIYRERTGLGHTALSALIHPKTLGIN
ncbi:radical SAM protein [Candidatus Bathyarchaeota archaeon]|nr:radical SAM protein [Candidatus Bathyarchaeota archaeon]